VVFNGDHHRSVDIIIGLQGYTSDSVTIDLSLELSSAVQHAHKIPVKQLVYGARLNNWNSVMSYVLAVQPSRLLGTLCPERVSWILCDRVMHTGTVTSALVAGLLGALFTPTNTCCNALRA